MKTIEELTDIYQNVILVRGHMPPAPITPRESWEIGIAAVRRAVIEDLAQEAEALERSSHNPFYCGQAGGDYTINDIAADWLRLHLDGEA